MTKAQVLSDRMYDLRDRIAHGGLLLPDTWRTDGTVTENGYGGIDYLLTTAVLRLAKEDPGAGVEVFLLSTNTGVCLCSATFSEMVPNAAIAAYCVALAR